MRNFNLTCAAVLVLTTSLWGVTVSAQDMVDARNPELIRNLASGHGSATMTTDNVGDPLISCRIDGLRYHIYFYGCDEGRDCRSIQFRAIWSGADGITQNTMSTWNREQRFGTAYIDRDGDVTLEWDVFLDFGVSMENLDHAIGLWGVMLRRYSEFLDEQTGSSL